MSFITNLVGFFMRSICVQDSCDFFFLFCLPMRYELVPIAFRLHSMLVCVFLTSFDDEAGFISSKLMIMAYDFST